MGIRGASYSEYHLVLVYNLLLGGFFGLSAGNSRGNCRFARINLFFWYRISLLLFQLACFGACNSRFDGSFARINLFFWLRISRLLFPFARFGSGNSGFDGGFARIDLLVIGHYLNIKHYQ
ncbi:hypothetical protein [Escherichia coli]|uniref:hypothetical protein n=1 Tax=Escherichia coli TaxID=562 RepID=UPI0028BE14A0|nr:hypothetical protein [Escherichia coli]